MGGSPYRTVCPEPYSPHRNPQESSSEPLCHRLRSVLPMKTSTAADYHERILRTLAHIQAHLDDAPDLDELACVACFSPYHFHRVFRGLVGEPVQEHVRRLRLERAAHRLKLQDEAVTSVALDAGYESHEAFTRAFHNMFGMSPTQFRAAHQSAPDSPSGVHYSSTPAVRMGHSVRITTSSRPGASAGGSMSPRCSARCVMWWSGTRR